MRMMKTEVSQGRRDTADCYQQNQVIYHSPSIPGHLRGCITE